MNTYIRERMRADAGHVVARAKGEESLVHKGLRGRFRELLVDTLLTPWLPAPAACGTGMIVDVHDRVREATQEDIVVFDRSLVPPVLAHASALEGVFPVDGVLARVEVKSTLTREEVRKSVLAAKEIYEMQYADGPASVLPISAIFAFSSDLKGNPVDELSRLLGVAEEHGLHYRLPCKDVPGPISAICVAGRGAWSFAGTGKKDARWIQAKTDKPHEEILHFVGTISNSCFAVGADRRGLGEIKGNAGGIGRFVLSFDTYETCSVQLPPMG